MRRPPQLNEPAPWFEARSPTNPRFHFDTVAGRYVVLCFFGSAAAPASRRVLDDVLQNGTAFDDEHVAFFGVSADPEDERSGRVTEQLPGVHLFWDFDGRVSRLFGALGDEESGGPAARRYRPFTLVLDERQRLVARLALEPAESHAERLMTVLSTLPPLGEAVLAEVQAPVLVLPRVFEPELCRALIDYHDAQPGEESGFMREVGGRTVLMHDPGHKRRRDRTIDDEPLRRACMVRIHDRLAPEVQRTFQFAATRIERYLVACYDGSDGGHFHAHRDNTTRGTAHRRFAVSLNLNTGEYEGGDLRFPEFGRQLYRAPAGGAVVFSCSLLHEATPVTDGRRYAFLPFLYDEAAARIREENRQFVECKR